MTTPVPPDQTSGAVRTLAVTKLGEAFDYWPAINPDTPPAGNRRR
jgi:hypothetical protein